MRTLVDVDPFRIGIVAIALGAVVGGIILVVSVSSPGTRSYTAELAQTAGLRVGEEVSVHGVTAGTVTDISLAGDRVRVRFTLDRSIRLGDRTSAQVKVATLLGTHMLAVDPSGVGTLPDGVVPLERTSVPYNLQDVLEKGTDALDRLDAGALAAALDEMTDVMDASGDQIGPALDGVARLSDMVAQRTDETARLVAAARGVTDQLARSSGDLISLMKRANLVIAEVTTRREAIHTLLTETERLATTLQRVMTRTKDDLAPAFKKLDRVVAILRDEEKSLKRLIRTGGPAVRFVANATGNGPWAELWTMPPALPPDDICYGPLKPVVGLACVK